MIAEYASKLSTALSSVETSIGQQYVSDDAAVRKVAALIARTDRKVIFIGNGGSAAIASHAAADYAANADVRAMVLTDPSSITCIANDHGFVHVFERQLHLHGDQEDLLVVISSSGKSENVLRATACAIARRMQVATMTGFAPDNRLRHLGQFNFWIPSVEYGVVETAHTALLHVLLEQVRLLKGMAGRNGRRDTY